MTVKIRTADGSTQDLTWAAGSALAPWPASLPIVGGVQYQVEWPDGADTSKLDIVTVNSLPTDDLVGAAQVLIEHGCQNQLDLLVDGASKVDKGN
jgi:hypothetical protein